MSKIITQCPSCKSTALSVIKIECNNCHTKFEGDFTIPKLLKLTDDELQFVIDFVKYSGSLKSMAQQHGISYPTLRNKLNHLIEALEKLEAVHQKKQSGNMDKQHILELLENGKITAAEAAKMLNKL